MRLVFSLSFLFLFIIPTKAQQPSFLLQWQKSLGGSGSEFLNSFEPTIDGGYILGGFSGSNISGDKTENSRGSYDYWVVKLNRDKNIEWQKTIGGDRFDWLYSVQQTTDGGYILGGSSESNKSGEKTDSARGGEDYWVLKLNSTGNIEWQKTIGGSGYDRLSSIQQTSDGGYILGGTSESNISGDKSENSRGSRDYWVIKLNDTGDIQWQKTFGGAAEDQLYSLRQALDGGYILGGTSMSDTGGEKSENNRGYYEDYWVLKLDNSGAIQWQKTIGGLTNDYLYAVRQTAEGGYILGGYSLSDISGEKTEESRGLGDYWIVKLNSSGNIQWQRTFGGANWEQLKSLQQTSDHGYILGGSSWSDSSGEKSEKLRGGIDYWVVKVDVNGELQWEKTIGGSSEDVLYSVSQDTDSGYVLGGYSISNISGEKLENSRGIADYWLIKINTLKEGPDTIRGQVFSSESSNCVPGRGLKDVLVRTTPADYYGKTDSTGFYQLVTDTGVYHVKQIIPRYLNAIYRQLCPGNNGYHTVKFTEYGKDTSGFNFANEVKLCPYLIVDINSDRRRRCFNNNTVIKYCNEGMADADNVQVHMLLPEYLNLVSSDKPYIVAPDGHYVFEIGKLKAGECGTVHIVDSVSCVNEITGLTQCTKVWITPANLCVFDTDSSNWDRSSIRVSGMCLGDSIVRFVITNTGSSVNGNMQGLSRYRIYADGVLASIETFQLKGEDSLVIEVKANGQTIRLEADQRPGHPGKSRPNAVIEACGKNSMGTSSMGFVDQQPQDDGDVEIESHCLRIRDSYDPNDKQNSPQGVTANRWVPHGVALDYQINFQNTGTDTAYKIVVVDTLPQSLDISSMQLGSSSHPYKLEVGGKGQPVLKFTFNNINLPDSNINEQKSHGFIKFKISPYDSVPNGRVIHNYADIYFDFNLPVRTNDAWFTVNDNLPSGAKLNIKVLTKNIIPEGNVKVYPNPFHASTTIYGLDKAVIVIIYDVNGRKVQTIKTSNQAKVSLYREALADGIYFYKALDLKGNRLANGKLMILK